MIGFRFLKKLGRTIKTNGSTQSLNDLNSINKQYPLERGTRPEGLEPSTSNFGD
jgi:hypothetical protein